MENDVFKTNPVFQNLSPEKLSFLMNFANSKKPETELMSSRLKQSMSPEEAEKADKIIRLMKERSGQSQ